MTTEQIQKREEELNKKCMECQQKYGIPSYDRCDSCHIGKEIHKLDFEKKSGWGSHEYWKGTR